MFPSPSDSEKGHPMIQIANGVYRMTFGTPEAFTPVGILKPRPRFEALNALPDCPPPFREDQIRFFSRRGSVTLELPLDPSEDLYGLGLMLKSFRQTGLKKKLRTNSDPTADTGDTHAPVPFCVSTAGYGILVDTARYASFHCGNVKKRGSRQDREGYPSAGTQYGHWWVKSGSGNLFIDIPAAEGVTLYLFCGESLKDAVARYNLFGGGGVFPPLWGLGVFYRAYMPGDQKHVMKLAKELREEEIPCDVFGLEPGWQTHAYSCTYQWDSERFPDPDGMLTELREMGYRPNLWEHAYVNPASPIFESMKDCSGDCYVWDGLVPDFITEKARDVFSSHHDAIRKQGVSGFKLDEADNSDFTANWGFPDFASFPSGLDGEQMHTVIGTLYQQVMKKPFDDSNERTFGQCRQSTALASSYPYVLYSDLYDHADFVRGMASAACSGLLWTPEVRFAGSTEELIRRIEAAVVSPQTVLNCYQVPTPPWRQWDYEKNMRGELLPDCEEVTATVRELLRFRMRLVPHLYTAYYRYYRDGIPPVRPPMMDYPDVPELRDVSDVYMIGEGLMAAPVVYGTGDRKRVFLPEGIWYDFWDGTRLEGGRFFEKTVPLGQIPLFLREGTLLALAEPLPCLADDTVFDITLFAYGEGDCSCTLIGDDGHSCDYLTKPPAEILVTATGNTYTVSTPHPRYRIRGLKRIL